MFCTISADIFASDFLVYLESYVQLNLLLLQDSGNSFGKLLYELNPQIASTQPRYMIAHLYASLSGNMIASLSGVV